MEQEIINLTKQILKHGSCPTCGGSYQEDSCIYCGYQNVELKDMINKLVFLLESYVKEFSFENILINELLNSLYNIHFFQIPIVNEFLINSNYQSLLINESNKIALKLNNNEPLLQEEYDFIKYLVINNHLEGSSLLAYTNILIKAIVQKQVTFSFEDIEEIVKIFGVETINNVIELKKGKCQIIEDDEKSGDSFGSTIRINKKQIEELKNGNPLLLFGTVFHELLHVRQHKKMSIEHCVSFLELVKLKDHLLSMKSKKFYDENYLVLSFENEAYCYQYLEAIDFMKTIGLEPTSNQIEFIKMHTSYHKKFVSKRTRKVGEKEENLDDLFDTFIIDKPHLLKTFPQLNIEYIIDKNEVRRKNLLELEMSYQNYLSGKNDYNGNPEEIDYFFKSLFEKAKNEEKKKSESK